MGPLDSPYSRFAVEITDSPYVVANLHLMTRVGLEVLRAMGPEGNFIPLVHSVGLPLSQPNQKDVPWPCNPSNVVVAHFVGVPTSPVLRDELSCWSYGSNFGFNAILSKHGLGSRLGSVLARKEGWIAQRGAILSMTSPEGNKHYISVVMPKKCGITELATLMPTIPGWTARCVSDDLSWLHIGEDNRLHAINPETGFFSKFFFLEIRKV